MQIENGEPQMASSTVIKKSKNTQRLIIEYSICILLTK